MSPWVPLHKIQSWRNHHCRDLSKTNLSTSIRVSLLGGKFWKKLPGWRRRDACLFLFDQVMDIFIWYPVLEWVFSCFLNLGSVFIVVSSISEISWKRWWTMTNNMFWEVFTCLTQTQTDRHTHTSHASHTSHFFSCAYDRSHHVLATNGGLGA